MYDAAARKKLTQEKRIRTSRLEIFSPVFLLESNIC